MGKCALCMPHTINSMSITKCQKHKPSQVQIFIWICLEIHCYFSFVVSCARSSRMVYWRIILKVLPSNVSIEYTCETTDFYLFLYISNGREKKCLSVSRSAIKKMGIEHSTVFLLLLKSIMRRWSSEKWYHSTERCLKMYARSIFLGRTCRSFR